MMDEEIFHHCENIEKILNEGNTRDELKKRIVDSIFVSYGAKEFRCSKNIKGIPPAFFRSLEFKNIF